MEVIHLTLSSNEIQHDRSAHLKLNVKLSFASPPPAYIKTVHVYVRTYEGRIFILFQPEFAISYR